MNKFNLTKDQIAEFITESNAIEGYVFDKSLARDELDGKASQNEYIYGQKDAFDDVKKFLTLKFDMSISHICEVHYSIMQHLLNPWDFGLRRELVSVGGRMCPYPIAIKPLLYDWCKKVNEMENPTEEDLWNTHLAFEYIHPFIDGNGRTGRLIWLWLRLKHGYGYKCVMNKTKHEEYYPQFDTFNWDVWMKGE